MLPKRDHTKLICDIGELTGLFHDAPSLEEFLQKITAMISEHMQSEVCSIYLYYDEAQQLILKATKGLNPSSIGKVKLNLGEGLVGLALKEYRSICEKNARKNPAFKYFPGIGEEPYESFLAVPIVRGTKRVGVLAIQNLKRDYFAPDDIQIMKAITTQLANTIETAKILMSLQGKQKILKEKIWDESIKLISGKVGAPGFAHADILMLTEESLPLKLPPGKFSKNSLEDFYLALAQTEVQLKDLQRQIEEKLSDVASLIFSAQILMLKDTAFVEAMVKLIESGVSPAQAILRVVEMYVSRFASLSDAYLREKGQDVKDVGRRLLENLKGEGARLSDYKDKLIVARELFPSDILKFSSQSAQGFIVLSGGASSHLSILARSLGLPLVIAGDERLLQLPRSTKILLDAEVGNIYINPSDEIVRKFKKRNEARAALSQVKDSVKPVTKTKDGERVILQATINLFSDLKLAKELQCEGIGLYRTEFPFIIRSDFPSEEEQFVIYKRLVEAMPDKEITFRTLDIGGDKVLSYYNFGKEENPFLGMRSIRFSLKYKDIFAQQIRAILRAGEKANFRIMFPMISSVDEFLEARQMVVNCVKDLTKEGLPCPKRPAVGIMVEMPSVLEIIDPLAKEADFFSIGTNDFIQYMLAVDRTNEKVADLYLPYHPSILRAFKRITAAAQKAKIDVSICGDMAHQESYIPFLLGIGIRKLSLDPRYIPRIQTCIGETDLTAAQTRAEEMLSKTRLSEIEKLLK